MQSFDTEIQSGSALKSIKKDELGRDNYVKNLANRIRSYSGSDSLTIGLIGPWGCGKTSLLNFLAEELEKTGKAIAVERFNPWNFSQQDRLVSTFFATLSSIVARVDKSAEARRASEALDLFALATAPASLIGLGFVSEGAKALSSMSKELAKTFGDVEAVKSEISSALEKSPKRYVIVIDDIDRLTHSEICQVFQLVKSMADFKNVVYVLAFDREIVASALDSITGGHGDGFLEKVVNIALRVPPVTQRQIRQMLLDVLRPYSLRQREYNWSNRRLQNIIEFGAKNMTTVRQIGRFANALVAVENLTVEDIDFTDHIGFTFLAALEPGFHEFLASHPELFVDDIANQLLRPDEKDDAERAIIDRELKSLKSLSREDALSILQAIFPKIKRIFAKGSKHWGDAEWRREFRACANPDTFSRYFTYRVDEGGISYEERESLWSAAQSPEQFAVFLRSVKNQEKLYRTLEYLGDLKAGEIAEGQVRSIFTAIVDVGDELEQLSGISDIFVGPFNEAVKACNFLLRILPEERRLSIALEAFQYPPKSLEMPTAIATRLGSASIDTLTESQARELAAELGKLFHRALEDGRLLSHPKAPYLIYRWVGLSPDEAKSAIRAVVAEDLEFLRFIGLYENIPTEKSFAPVRLDCDALSRVLTLDEIREHLDRLPRESGSENDARIAELIAEVNKARTTKIDESANPNGTPTNPGDNEDAVEG